MTKQDLSSRSVTIRAENLSKLYGDFAALHSVSFSVRQGTVAAFLGPQRRRQVDHDEDPDRLPRRRPRARARCWASTPATRSSASRWPGASGTCPRTARCTRDMTPRETLEFVAQIRGLGGTTSRRDRAGRRAVRDRRRDEQAGRQALEGLPPARRHGPGAAARPRGADPRRADLGPRPAADPRGPLADPRARPEQDDPALDPHPARSRPSPARSSSSARAASPSPARSTSCARAPPSNSASMRSWTARRRRRPDAILERWSSARCSARSCAASSATRPATCSSRCSSSPRRRRRS
jgi:hypothetical protein